MNRTTSTQTRSDKTLAKHEQNNQYTNKIRQWIE